jgi:hypothetical protein
MVKKEHKFWGNSHAESGKKIEPSIGILKKVGNDDVLSPEASGYLIFGGGISFNFNVSEFLRRLGAQ